MTMTPSSPPPTGPPIAGTTPAVRPGAPEAWAWFAAWVVAGSALVLGVLSLMTIGILVLPLAMLLTVGLAAVPRARASAPGALCGASLPFFLAAWANRDGPGTICRPFANGGTHCTEEWSPLPFLAIALAFVAAGAALQVRSRRPH